MPRVAWSEDAFILLSEAERAAAERELSSTAPPELLALPDYEESGECYVLKCSDRARGRLLKVARVGGELKLIAGAYECSFAEEVEVGRVEV